MGYADLEKDDKGYLLNTEDWNEDIAREIAKAESLELTQRHWDIIAFLRDEFFDNNGHQPNERAMVKAMSEKWGESVATKDLYDLFPMQPSKQAGKVAGLPETKRKGGY
ncbi:TusE/DsrC/DsvC family sulfur relay protein [Magnetospirillum sp. UT-4]|uniref:TusE/DsrC/DsvC family sulfur relay protein n=1 Tax=Magnetospirillum sp. UT-4 TaxID=2681467 RepID=UPI00138627BC|nr:TusE/DsrC/DsvC family sulfur relay protein [Magnetospirillum sp. UT-4]CAA7626421.1 Sulfurtransferase TusE homolog [Magnetospirillum sp. UT-4]